MPRELSTQSTAILVEYGLSIFAIVKIATYSEHCRWHVKDYPCQTSKELLPQLLMHPVPTAEWVRHLMNW